jgi:hypothetical protein
MVMRPGDQFTITGLAGTFLKVGAASLLARAVEAAGVLLLLLPPVKETVNPHRPA